jgi:hypothetical protein
LRLLECEDYGLELASLTSENLGAKLAEAWDARTTLQERQRPIIKELKAGAEYAADLLASKYFGAKVAKTAKADVVAQVG